MQFRVHSKYDYNKKQKVYAVWRDGLLSAADLTPNR